MDEMQVSLRLRFSQIDLILHRRSLQSDKDERKWRRQDQGKSNSGGRG